MPDDALAVDKDRAGIPSVHHASAIGPTSFGDRYTSSQPRHGSPSSAIAFRALASVSPPYTPTNATPRLAYLADNALTSSVRPGKGAHPGDRTASTTTLPA